MNEKELVVDDEREIANWVSLYLQNENYTVYKYYIAHLLGVQVIKPL